VKSKSIILGVGLLICTFAEVVQAQGFMRMHPYDTGGDLQWEGSAPKRDYWIQRKEQAEAENAKRAALQPDADIVFRTNKASHQQLKDRFLIITANDSASVAEFKSLALQLVAEINAGQALGRTSEMYVNLLIEQADQVNMENITAKKIAVLAQLANQIRTENRRISHIMGDNPRPAIRY
jgi:hypothetical protein